MNLTTAANSLAEGAPPVQKRVGGPMRFSLRHITTYRYANPVTLGRHRLMLRPRDSHEMKLHGATLGITPTPSQVVWQYDVFGNSVALIDFAEPATELTIDSTLDVERFPFVNTDHLVDDHARNLPLAYSADDIRDLAGLQERHVADPDHAVDLWAKGFLASVGKGDSPTPETLAVLNAMAAAIKENFSYMARDAYGTQSPLETLATGSGTCRDFAYLMMEGARSLGLAARFVSGYLYDSFRDLVAGQSMGTEPNTPASADNVPSPPGSDVGPAASPAPVPVRDGGVVGGGATHAWVQIYLPGAGWTHFDPTNALASDADLIPVAVVRDPAQASPVAGSWQGLTGDAMGMDVVVQVTAK